MTLVGALRADPVLSGRLDAVADGHREDWDGPSVVTLAPRADGVVRVLRRHPRHGILLAASATPTDPVRVSAFEHVDKDLAHAPGDVAFDAAVSGGSPLVLDRTARHASTARVMDAHPQPLTPGLREAMAAVLADPPRSSRLYADRSTLHLLLRVRAALRGQEALFALVDALPPMNAALARTVIGPDPTFEPDHALAVGECAQVRNPGWVGEAVARHPMLRHLFYATGSNRPVSRTERRTHIADLDRGMAPGNVVSNVVAGLDGPRVRGGDLHPSTASTFSTVWPDHRHLGETRGLGSPPHERFDLVDGRRRPSSLLLQVLGEFYATRPKHRPLGQDELAALHGLVRAATMRAWPSALDVARALPCLMDEDGRLAPPPAHLEDVIASVTVSVKAVLVPLLGREGHRATALASAVALDRVLPAGRKAAGLAAADAAWHATAAAFERELADHGDAIVRRVAAERGVPVVGALAFPHFLSAPVTRGGLTAVPLTDAPSLLREGEGMRHCVGARHATARRGAEFVVAFEGDGARSTASYALRGSDGRVRMSVTEHRGPANGEPAPSHVVLARSLAEEFDADADASITLRDEVALAGSLSDVASDPFAHVDEGEARTFREIHFSNVRVVLRRSEAAMDVDDWAVHAIRGRADDLLPLLQPHEAELRDLLTWVPSGPTP